MFYQNPTNTKIPRRFRAGSFAPSADELFRTPNYQLIPNTCGDLALKLVAIDEEKITKDDNGSLPLVEAVTQLVSGHIDQEAGVFVETGEVEGELDATITASAIYKGPGTDIILTEEI